ncbi:MAG: cytochrome P450 [bacterium]|nr:cytochrome P450 [Deltaproteobacteria bacterium]MCP4907128.1 cytochrome P450 [bacterium]
MRAPYEDLPSEPEEIFARILDWRRRGPDLIRLYHQLRVVAPIWQSPVARLGKPWVITRHADASALVRNAALVKDERFLGLSGIGNEGAFIGVMRRMFAFQPPPRHTRMRGLVNRAFTPSSIEKLRPRVQALVDELIDSIQDRGEMDIVADFAFRVPVTVICEMLGAPVEDVPRIRDLAGTFARRADEGEELTPEMDRLGDHAAENFSAYIMELVAERRANPRDDLLSRLLAVQHEADDLTDEDIVATTILLFQAGHDTTANLIAKATLALLGHPDEMAKLRAHPELIENATEELLRYDTSVQLTTKFAAEEIPFHDRVIAEGDPVTFIWAAINRDPERYEDPDRLDLSRENIDHYSFGMGAHYCLGARLARLEIQHAIGTLVRRLPGLRLETDCPEYRPQLHLHGLARLPVSW